MSDFSCVVESNYGKIVARARFVGIKCEQEVFVTSDGAVDTNSIRLYGLAIEAAVQIIAHHDWLLTESGHLVAGVTGKKVPTIEALLSIDSNVNALADAAFRLIKGGVKPCDSILKIAFADMPRVMRELGVLES